MPQLVKLQDELKDSGFIIIGAHSQNATKDEVNALLRKNRVNYTVTSSANVPDNPVSGLPAGFLFDASGNLAEKGIPLSMKKKIHDLVQSEPHFIAAGKKYTKLAPVAESLKKTKAYGPILKKLEKDAAADGATGEEAKYLKERIEGYGKKRLEAAKELEGGDPFLALKEYSEVAVSWKGHEIGTQAGARVKELKADKEFQTELQASEVLHGILAECEKLVPTAGGINLEYASNKKIAANVRSAAAVLKKKYPKSKATAGLADTLRPFGFKEI